MKLDRTLTATVYVVNKDRVLLHMHKKYNSLFALGGHMKPDELPHETAIREVFEESGLEVKLLNEDNKLDLGKVVQLNKPRYVLLENVGHPIENIDFIFFATTSKEEFKPQDGESKDLYWLTKEEIIDNKDIKPHIKSMALDALNTVKGEI
ncbi:NUDIX domain-containing protein [Paraclostridium bifermentans]|uniref:NUDIX domain-containing protein n=1 Tax=Paraclostridium bifermentans TaxID=1490 RepID=UPI00374F6905